MKYNFGASSFAGCFAAMLTNPLECITVNKQTNSNFVVSEFIKKEGLKNVIMKGMCPRVAYNGLQSVLFFSLGLVVNW